MIESKTTRRSARPATEPRRSADSTPRGQIYLLLITVAVVSGFVVHGRFHWDDAYITFRMATNIAHGHGWTYNPGLSQDAATGALWTLVLAGLAWLHIGVVGSANVLAVVFLGGAAILMFETLRLLGAPRAGVFVGVLICGSQFLMVTTGMELPLAIFLIAAAMYLNERQWYGWAGASIGLAIMTRGDIALFGAVLGISVAMRWRKQVWRYAAGAAGVLLPWALLAEVAVGHVLPDTLTAKIDQGRSGFWSGHATYLGTLRELPYQPPTGGGHLELWFSIVMILAVIGCVGLVLRPMLWPLIPLVVFGFVYVAVYGYVLRVPGYPWYYAVPVFAGLVVAGIGLDVLAAPVLGRMRLQTAFVPTLAALGITATSLAGAPTAYPRLNSYVAASRWLNAHASSDKTVAAAEVGIIGWNSPDRTVIDYLGLTSTAAAQRVRHGDMLWWVSHETPDYWITLNGPSFPVDQELIHAPWLLTSFRVVWSDPHVLLYQRVGPIPPQT